MSYDKNFCNYFETDYSFLQRITALYNQFNVNPNMQLPQSNIYFEEASHKLNCYYSYIPAFRYISQRIYYYLFTCLQNSRRNNQALQLAEKDMRGLLLKSMIWGAAFNIGMFSHHATTLEDLHFAVCITTHSKFKEIPIELILKTGLLIDSNLLLCTKLLISSDFLIMPLKIQMPNVTHIKLTQIPYLLVGNFSLTLSSSNFPNLEELELSDITYNIALPEGYRTGRLSTCTRLSFPYQNKKDFLRLVMPKYSKLHTLILHKVKFPIYLSYEYIVLSKNLECRISHVPELQLSSPITSHGYILSSTLNKIIYHIDTVKRVVFSLQPSLLSNQPIGENFLSKLYLGCDTTSLNERKDKLLLPFLPLFVSCKALYQSYSFKKIDDLQLSLCSCSFCVPYSMQDMNAISLKIENCSLVNFFLFPRYKHLFSEYNPNVLSTVRVQNNQLSKFGLKSYEDMFKQSIQNFLLYLDYTLNHSIIQKSHICFSLFIPSEINDYNSSYAFFTSLSQHCPTIIADIRRILVKFIHRTLKENADVTMTFDLFFKRNSNSYIYLKSWNKLIEELNLEVKKQKSSISKDSKQK